LTFSISERAVSVNLLNACTSTGTFELLSSKYSSMFLRLNLLAQLPINSACYKRNCELFFTCWFGSIDETFGLVSVAWACSV
jgi:hypothetical protein